MNSLAGPSPCGPPFSLPHSVMVPFQPSSQASVPRTQRDSHGCCSEGAGTPHSSALVHCGFGSLSFRVGTTEAKEALTRSAFGPGEVWRGGARRGKGCWGEGPMRTYGGLSRFSGCPARLRSTGVAVLPRSRGGTRAGWPGGVRSPQQVLAAHASFPTEPALGDHMRLRQRRNCNLSHCPVAHSGCAAGPASYRGPRAVSACACPHPPTGAGTQRLPSCSRSGGLGAPAQGLGRGRGGGGKLWAPPSRPPRVRPRSSPGALCA